MTSEKYKSLGQKTMMTMYVLLIVTLCGLVWFGCGAVIIQSKQPKPQQSPLSRILKGRKAIHGEHPYLVSVQYLHFHNESGRFYAPFCGGAIVDRRTILTAGHCFETKPDCWVTDPTICYRIVAGEHDLTKDDQNKQIHVVSTNAISVHENYDGFHYDNDIAMIRLDEALQFNDHVKRIPMVKQGHAYSDTAVIAGWGVTSPEDSPSILQEANVTIYSDKQCETQWGDDFHKEGMICAGNKQVSDNEVGDYVADACWGDSGGPLITTDLADPPRKHLIGIISWGYDCGYHEYPGLYTRIESYLDWIQENRRSRRHRRLMRWRRLGLHTPRNRN